MISTEVLADLRGLILTDIIQTEDEREKERRRAEAWRFALGSLNARGRRPKQVQDVIRDYDEVIRISTQCYSDIISGIKSIDEKASLILNNTLRVLNNAGLTTHQEVSHKLSSLQNGLRIALSGGAARHLPDSTMAALENFAAAYEQFHTSSK